MKRAMGAYSSGDIFQMETELPFNVEEQYSVRVILAALSYRVSRRMKICRGFGDRLWLAVGILTGSIC